MLLNRNDTFEHDTHRWACFAPVQYGRYTAEPYKKARHISMRITATVISHPKKFDPSPTEYVEVYYECYWNGGGITFIHDVPRESTKSDVMSCTPLWTALCALFQAHSLQKRDPATVTKEESEAEREKTSDAWLNASPTRFNSPD